MSSIERDNLVEDEKGGVEKAKEWLQKNARAIVASAAILGFGAYDHNQRETIEQLRGTIAEMEQEEMDQGTPKVELTEYREVGSGSLIQGEITLEGDGNPMPMKSGAKVAAVLDNEGKLIRLTLVGINENDSGLLNITKSGEKIYIDESTTDREGGNYVYNSSMKDFDEPDQRR